ncbi:MAG TPA: OmpA family protein [Caulobacteraceae bacterium]|jgi:outer membrane protein OmpA-like peptidoglycan-associated protein
MRNRASLTGGLAIAAALALLAGAMAGCQSRRAAAAGPLIQAPPDCVDVDFPIYFEPRSAAITREADQLIASAGQRARGCDVTGIVVVGLADARGAAGANLTLSRRRTEAVTRDMHRHGFTTVEFRERAVGANIPAGDPRLLRRRVDVSIHLMNRPVH